MLTGQRSLLRHALDAVDAVVGNLGPLPAPMAAMLFQSEAQQDSLPVLLFNAAAYCPKIGTLLEVGGDRNPLTAPLPDKSFNCLEAVLSDVSCELCPTGAPKTQIPDPSWKTAVRKGLILAVWCCQASMPGKLESCRFASSCAN